MCNVLLTCCKDSVCRLWAETLLPGDGHLSGYHSNLTASQHSDTVKSAASSKKKSCNGKMHINPGVEVSYVKNTLLAVNDIIHAEHTPVMKFIVWGERNKKEEPHFTFKTLNISTCLIFCVSHSLSFKIQSGSSLDQ